MKLRRTSILNSKIFFLFDYLLLLEMNHAVMTEIDLKKKTKQLHKNKELLLVTKP
jgi:hypothetical protein